MNRKATRFHPNFPEIKQHVVERFHSEFNNLPLDVVEKYYDNCLFDHIVVPDEEVLAKEWFEDLVHEVQAEVQEEYNQDEGMYYPDDRTEFFHWLTLCQDHRSSYLDHFAEREWYPMWGTVFEAKDDFMCTKIQQYTDELYEIGIGVIQGKDNLNHMLFIAGAGYDFYEEHWVPMLELFGWIPEELLEVKDEN